MEQNHKSNGKPRQQGESASPDQASIHSNPQVDSPYYCDGAGNYYTSPEKMERSLRQIIGMKLGQLADGLDLEDAQVRRLITRQLAGVLMPRISKWIDEERQRRIVWEQSQS